MQMSVAQRLYETKGTRTEKKNTEAQSGSSIFSDSILNYTQYSHTPSLVLL